MEPNEKRREEVNQSYIRLKQLAVPDAHQETQLKLTEAYLEGAGKRESHQGKNTCCGSHVGGKPGGA